VRSTFSVFRQFLLSRRLASSRELHQHQGHKQFSIQASNLPMFLQHEMMSRNVFSGDLAAHKKMLDPAIIL
jgi:hypothetical protein